MTSLAIMNAPNGARPTAADHPRLPLTIDAIAEDAAAVAAAGAQAVHIHVRDEEGRHVLDAARHLAAERAIRQRVGNDLVVQMTTEAVGRYTPRQQIELVQAVAPEAVSIAMAELMPDASAEAAALDLYRWMHARRMAVQHILYTPEEFLRFTDYAARGLIPGERYSVIFPLGRYVSDRQSRPEDLMPFVAALQRAGGAERYDWWVCAFGALETRLLTATAALGGHCRIGFENNFLNSDGGVAADNADRVADLRRALAGIGRAAASREETLRALGRPD
ncbi:MAG: 3-keto-5-aminohexanoate cleavage protein [Xanthobacteraceae bacterium]